MTLSRIGNSCFYDKLQGTKEQNTTYPSTNQTFANRFSQKESEKAADIAVEETTRTNCLSTSVLLHSSGRLSIQSTIECSVRHISYEEADNVKVSVENGYTLKAQVSITEHKVYIEKKTEDGSITAYEFNPLQIDSDTQNPIEQMAVESWELAQRGFAGETPFFQELDSSNDYMDMSIEDAMNSFYHFIEDRIKNGDPKYQTGGSEMSVKEWQRLMEYIDDTIDEIREELRSEAAKNEERMLKRKSESTNTSTITAEQIARLFEDFTADSSKNSSDSDVTADFKVHSDSETSPAVKGSSLTNRINGKRAPYDALADENGTIVYNGVTLQCDFDNNRLTLGDCSNLDNCIRVPLSDGGEFVFNREELNNVAKIISMFSPEDQYRIMRAITLDKQCQKKLQEMDDEVAETFENISEV